MRQSLVTRLALNAANLLVIGFLLLPIAAATIGALQSAKSLQASTRSVLPPEWTLDNFRVILRYCSSFHAHSLSRLAEQRK